MDFFKIVSSYIKSELIIVIPVLFILTQVLKKSKLKKSHIPLIITGVSILITGLYIFSSSDFLSAKGFLSCLFSVLTQGILLSGASALMNEVIRLRKCECSTSAAKQVLSESKQENPESSDEDD